MPEVEPGPGPRFPALCSVVADWPEGLGGVAGVADEERTDYTKH